MTTAEIEIKLIHTLNTVSNHDWQCFDDGSFPFTDLSFLKSLEESRCLGDRTGWLPYYLLAYQNNILVGALILFAKDNSYGEYIFDFNWAQASESSGVAYYPKFVSAIPFTPATGTKILLDKSLENSAKQQLTENLLEFSLKVLKSSNASSLHFLFIPEQQISLFEKHGFFIRNSFQFHWKNSGYKNFDDFLKNLRSKRRREVVRERSQVAIQGLTIQKLTADQLTDQHANLMFHFYLSTIEKREGQEYLTDTFFRKIFATMKKNILFIVALKDGKEVAAALNFIGRDALYGRYWGSSAEYRSLHFEVCYYQGIEFCIENGLNLFEAGAQGEHKFQRGFLPSLTYSAHHIKHPGLESVIQDFTENEKIQLKYLFTQYSEHSPFSRGD